MERDDHAPVATFFAESSIAAGTTATLGESAAHHARVKRLDVGDVVRLTDGAGRTGQGTVAAIRRGALDVAVESVNAVERPWPIHLRVPVSDRDRMLWLAEKATELGISTWQAVRFRRSASVSPRGEGGAFAQKVRSRMIGALEQSSGGWLPAVLPDITVDALPVSADELPIVLDPCGEPLGRLLPLASKSHPVIVFGPEGGIEDDELSALVARGWQRASIGSATLRFETAGIAAVAVLRAIDPGGA